MYVSTSTPRLISLLVKLGSNQHLCLIHTIRLSYSPETKITSMPDNKYVSFVSNEHFLKCVKWVCDSYPSSDTVNDELLQRNGIDPFKMIFDIMNSKTNLEKWRTSEYTRQADKTINNRIGDFHQKLLGGVDGWTDLGVGDDTKLDLKKDDDTIFLELKNKFNTVNSDSLSKVREKLETNLKNFPNSVNYWAFIVHKNGTSGESDWIHRKENNLNIRKIWGDDIYTMITNQKGSLEKVWNVLPSAINDTLSSNHELKDIENLKALFKKAF